MKFLVAVFLISTFLISCQSPQKFSGSRHPANNSRRFEHYQPVTNLNQLKSRAGRSMEGCNSISMTRRHRQFEIIVDGEEFVLATQSNDDWDVQSETTDSHVVIENLSIPYADDPLSFGSCADCYLDNVHKALVIYPPPHGREFDGFEVVEKKGNEIVKQVTCGRISNRQDRL